MPGNKELARAVVENPMGCTLVRPFELTGKLAACDAFRGSSCEVSCGVDLEEPVKRGS